MKKIKRDKTAQVLSKLGEHHVEDGYKGRYPLNNDPVIKPTQFDKDNPPASIQRLCVTYGHLPTMFWCYRHGEYFSKWEWFNGRVDLMTCQCDKCIQSNIYSAGWPVKG